MQKWAFTLFCPLVFDFCWQGEDGQPLPKCSACAAAALSQAETQDGTIVLQRTLSEKLHFRTCTLHCFHPSLQAWHRAWHISEPCWKSGCNCQFKLILTCIIKEMVIHTQIYQMDLIALQTGITSSLFFFSFFLLFSFSCSQESTALNRALVYDHLSWVPAVCKLLLLESSKQSLFTLNSGRNPGAVQCLPWRCPGWTQHIYIPG